MKKILTLLLIIASTPAAFSAGASAELKQVQWPFDGVTGTFDRPSVQRGFQVYKEVCAACHGLRQVAYRSLADVGFSADEIKAIAAEQTVIDGPNDDGEMFERAARPSDKFVSPFANQKAARASNGGAYPVDLSLIVKARGDGANYLYSLLTGYKDAPEGFDIGNLHYNEVFPGQKIAMAAPISAASVEYEDGTDANLHQIAYDVTNFLQWAAEPEMEQRKRMGIKVLLFMFFFTVFYVYAKKRVWSDVKKGE